FIAFAKKYPSAPGSLTPNPFRTDAEVRNDAKLNLCLRNLLIQPLKIAPADVQKVYDMAKSRLVQPAQLHLRLIVKTDQAKALEALKSVEKGVPFDKVALKESDDPGSRQKGGDIGFLPENRLPAALLAAVKPLKPNEYTKQVITVDLPPQVV